MLFAFLLVDRPGAAALRAEHRPAHKAYLADVAERICVADGGGSELARGHLSEFSKKLSLRRVPEITTPP